MHIPCVLKLTFYVAVLMAVGVLPGTQAIAQPGAARGLPSPEVIANADNFQPPRIADYAAKFLEQPDMTGVWTAMQPADAGAGPTFDPVNTFWPPQPVEGEARFGPVPGTYIKGIPYTAEYQKKYNEYIQEAQEGKSRDDFAACVPYGVPRMIGDSPVAFDIIQAPELMIWYNPYGRTERRIFLDGRKHPREPASADNALGAGPSYSGHSTGYWEGNTLVVETVDMLGDNFDETSAPYSPQLEMVERMRLIDTNIMEIQMTFTDPVAFTKPWVVTRYFRRGGGGRRNNDGTPAPPAAAVPTSGITRGTLINLNDRPCIPNVEMDEDGYQLILLPAELEARNAAKAKEAAARKKKR